MKPAKKKVEPRSVLNFFATRKRIQDLPADDFLAKRLREEKESSENCTNNNQQQNCNKQNYCVDCKEKDIEIRELNKTLKDYEKINNELLKDNKSLKHLVSKCTKVNLLKDLKIEQLAKQQEESSVHDPLIFNSYQHIFDSSELTTLRSIPFVSSRDSSFILQVLRLLYKNDLSALNSRTASSKAGDKNPISPEKKAVMSGLYLERLNCLKLSDSDLKTRKSKLNEYTMTGIFNIRKSLKRQSV